jgi:hypothetical protein
LAVKAGGLQSEEGLIISQIFDESAVTEDISIVPGDSKNWSPGPKRLQWNDGALLASKGIGGVQEFEDIGLALAQRD